MNTVLNNIFLKISIFIQLNYSLIGPNTCTVDTNIRNFH